MNTGVLSDATPEATVEITYQVSCELRFEQFIDEIGASQKCFNGRWIQTEDCKVFVAAKEG